MHGQRRRNGVSGPVGRHIRNFDNTDDYREELQRVRNAQGPNVKFDYNDYVVKILLATFIKTYFNLDQANLGNNAGTNQRMRITTVHQQWKK